MPSSSLEARALLVELMRAVTRAMFQSPWYSPSHPDARRAVDHVHQTHKKLIDGPWSCHEVLVVTAGEGRWDDALVAGPAGEPILLSQLLHGTMGDHLHQRLLALFEQQQLLGLGLRRGLTRGDIERLMVEVAQRLMDERKDAEAPRRPMRTTLAEAVHEQRLDRISLLSADELLPAHHETTWIVRVNLSRLRVDLERASSREEPREALEHRAVADSVLALGTNALRRELLTAAAEYDVPRRDESLQDVLSARLPEAVRASLAWDLIASLEDPGATPAARAEARKLLGVLAQGIGSDPGPASADLLLLLHRREIVDFEVLPEALKDKLRVRKLTDQLLVDPQAYLERLDVLETPALLSEYLGSIRLISRELLSRGRHAESLSVLRALNRILAEDGEAGWRAPLVREALDWIRRVDVAPALAEAARTEEAPHRRVILDMLAELGIQMLFPLLTLLGHVRTAAARKDVCDTIRQMGPDVEPVLVQELLRITHPWFLHRNILMLLGELGARHAVRDVQRMLDHPHIRVREQAASTLVAIVGEEAEHDLVACLRTGDRELLVRAVQLLTKIRCQNEAFHTFLRQQIATLLGPEDTDELLVTQCLVAAAELGAIWPEQTARDVERLLLDVLDPPLSRALLRRAQGRRLPARLREHSVQALCSVASGRSKHLLERLSRDQVLGVRQTAAARLSSL